MPSVWPNIVVRQDLVLRNNASGIAQLIDNKKESKPVL
jgi:hypothetical protein